MGVEDEMGIINGWQQAPETVDLGVVFIDLGSNQENR